MTKIFNGNQYVGKFKCDGRKYTKFQLFKMKTIKFIQRLVLYTVALSVFCGIVYGAFKVGGMYVKPEIVEAKVEVIKEVETPSPVMERIAKCESGGHHTKNGQVIINVNNNKTSDIGLFQINSIWNKKATDLGLNLSVEADNRAFAMWLYKNHGTSDWSASYKCWSK